MEKYNSKCSDNDNLIKNDELFNKIKINENNDTSLNVVDIENEVNNILRGFNIQIENDHGLSVNNNLNENNKNEKVPKICSLVDTIYDENNSYPDTLVNDITNEYGNCFIPKDNNVFQNECKQSCYLKENTLEICNEYSIEGINNCRDYSKIPGNTLNDIHIEKNGLYYNCSKINNNNKGVIEYNETPCIPKNKMCTVHNMGFLKKCEDHNASMEFPCEDYHIFENGNYYNCISDDTKFNEETESHSCVKSIKEKFTKPCIKEQIINYSECKQIYD